MARPSKYTSELLEKAYDYLENWNKKGELIPTHRSLAFHLCITRQTLYAWNKDLNKYEFSDILGRIMDIQELELINKGLLGIFNPTIAKLILGKHGYSSKKNNRM